MSASDVRMGIHRHYKGPLYQVLGLAHDANDDARTCVVYVPLQLDGSHLGPRLAVRTLEDFVASVEVRGEVVRRFTYLGPVLTAEMLPPASSTVDH